MKALAYVGVGVGTLIFIVLGLCMIGEFIDDMKRTTKQDVRDAVFFFIVVVPVVAFFVWSFKTVME